MAQDEMSNGSPRFVLRRSAGIDDLRETETDNTIETEEADNSNESISLNSNFSDIDVDIHDTEDNMSMFTDEPTLDNLHFYTENESDRPRTQPESMEPGTPQLRSPVVDTIVQPAPPVWLQEQPAELPRYEEDTVEETDPITIDGSSLEGEGETDGGIEKCNEKDDPVADGSDVSAVPMSMEQRGWVARNCSSCVNFVTLSNFAANDFPMISIKFPNSGGRFTVGQCFSKEYIRRQLIADLGQATPSNFFLIFKIYNYRFENGDPMTDGHLRSGTGARPTHKVVFAIRGESVIFYITLGSLERLFSSDDNTFYALPINGGRRHRIGNFGLLAGSNMVSANHAQAPGFQVYKLYTRDQILRGVAAVEEVTDFTLTTPVLMGYETLLNVVFNDISHARTMVMDSIIRYMLAQFTFWNPRQ